MQVNRHGSRLRKGTVGTVFSTWQDPSRGYRWMVTVQTTSHALVYIGAGALKPFK